MRRLAALATVVAALAAAPAAVAAPPLAFPNPILSTPTADYVRPLLEPDGSVAALQSLGPRLIGSALTDYASLRYLHGDDLGGFRPATPGAYALVSGGRDVVGAGLLSPEIPRYAQTGGGRIQVFAMRATGVRTRPDNGRRPVKGLGVPRPVPPPTNSDTVPPPNQGFGGVPGKAPSPATTTTTTTPTISGGGGRPSTTTSPPPPTPQPRATTTRPSTTTSSPTTTTRPRRPTTTAPTTTAPTTTAPTTTAPTTTTTRPTTTAPTTTRPPTSTTAPGSTPSSTGGGTTTTTTTPPGSAGSCGIAGLAITSDLNACRIVAANMAPGGSALEHVTIQNTANETVTLSLRVVGLRNRLWDDLRFGIWEQGTPVPDPLPPLLWWTVQENALTTLAPGASVHYSLELYLPGTAGNADQSLAAVFSLLWHAHGA